MASNDHSEPLQLLGLGTYRPASRRSVAVAAAAQGVDASEYHGWPVFDLAGDDEHPSDMATSAVEAALTHAGCDASALGLVLFVGTSRDYVPSWSGATEVMKRLGCGGACVGFDLTSGCMGSVLGLDVAAGWLRGRPGAVAAVVAAERWAATVSYGDAGSMGLWSHSDGASAMIVGHGAGAPLAHYLGASYTGDASWNGHVLVPHGGTRSPVAPAGEGPGQRVLSGRPRSEVLAHYRAGYEAVIAEARGERTIAHVVCNQVSPRMVDYIGTLSGVTAEQVVRSGLERGHVGSADLGIGLAEVCAAGPLTGDVLVAASTSYGFGAGLFTL